jgi:hypothetical protein
MESVIREVTECNMLEGKQLKIGDLINVKWLNGNITKEVIYIDSSQNVNYKRAFIITTINELLVRIYLAENPKLLCERFYE